MAEQNKTRRFFDLILWLQKEGRSGISRDRICDEYKISEKTFLRDVQELCELLPTAVRYDREEDRLFATLSLLERKGGPSPQTAPHPGKMGAVPAEALVERPGTPSHSLTDSEFQSLLEAVLEGGAVDFYYREKTRTGFPLFFCRYAERWYLFLFMADGGGIRKFRLDQVHRPARPLVAPVPPKDLTGLKQEAADRIRKSHNIFVDLNAKEPLSANLRFFYPASFLREQIPRMESVGNPDPSDPSVTDAKIEFSGYNEARVFLNGWLGHFQILGPPELRARYSEELEEALDSL